MRKWVTLRNPARCRSTSESSSQQTPESTNERAGDEIDFYDCGNFNILMTESDLKFEN